MSGMRLRRVEIVVKEVQGVCPLYSPGDRIVLEGYYVKASESKDVCIHALSAMLTLLTLISHGFSTLELGLGPEEGVAYLQCPDPGPPRTCGGTVLFELRCSG